MRRPSNTNPDKEMPFTEHLEELRWHILRSLLYVVVASAVCWSYYEPIFHFIAAPIQKAYQSNGFRADLVFFDILEPLLFRLQLVLTVGFIVVLPLLLWEVWRFVAPGLYALERRFVAPLLPLGVLLCFAGVSLVYFALPIAFGFLLKFAPRVEDAQLMQHLQRYFFFLLRMMIAAAVTFQTPIVLLLLGQLELVTAVGLIRFWRHAVLLCFSVAAVITPTIDPLNMSIIAVPLCGLYCFSVVLVWWVERGRARQAAKRSTQVEDPADTPPPPTAPSPPVSHSPADDPTPPSATPPAPPAKQDLASTSTPTAPSAPTVVDRSALGPLAAPRDDDETDEDSSLDAGNRDDP